MNRVFKIEDSNISDEVKKIRIIFTSEKWGSDPHGNTCPSCHKAPIQLLFTESIELDGKYVIGQCLLCKQLVAYKGLVHDGKRSKIRNHTRKSIFGGNPVAGRQVELLLRHLVSQIHPKQKHHVKNLTKKKNSDDKKDEQMKLELCHQ